MPPNVCSVCGKPISTGEAFRAGPKLCNECRAEDPDRALSAEERARREQRERVQLLARQFPQWTTMPPGEFESLGIVSGTAVMGAHVFLDIAAAVTDVIGGRSGRYQSVLDEGRTIALGEMCAEAESRGAEMVVGVRLGIEPMEKMFVVTATGTAVRRTA